MSRNFSGHMNGFEMMKNMFEEDILFRKYRENRYRKGVNDF